MANTNEVRLTGNLGKDAEFKAEVGTGLATFSLAYNRYRPTSNGYDKMPTQWFRCVGWGKVAERIAQLKKGERVSLVGRLESRTWKDTKGVEHSSIEIVVESIERAEVVKAQKAMPTGAEDATPLTRPAAQAKKTASTKPGNGGGAGASAVGTAAVGGSKSGGGTAGGDKAKKVA